MIFQAIGENNTTQINMSATAGQDTLLQKTKANSF
jgi:hypothetical protein